MSRLEDIKTRREQHYSDYRRIWEAIEGVDYLIARAEALEKVAEAAKIFANRVDELAPKVNAAICFCHVHGQEWNRADSWEVERDALDAALAALEEGEG